MYGRSLRLFSRLLYCSEKSGKRMGPHDAGLFCRISPALVLLFFRALCGYTIFCVHIDLAGRIMQCSPWKLRKCPSSLGTFFIIPFFIVPWVVEQLGSILSMSHMMLGVWISSSRYSVSQMFQKSQEQWNQMRVNVQDKLVHLASITLIDCSRDVGIMIFHLKIRLSL